MADDHIIPSCEDSEESRDWDDDRTWVRDPSPSEPAPSEVEGRLGMT
jgi:hypothetical protein